MRSERRVRAGVEGGRTLPPLHSPHTRWLLPTPDSEETTICIRSRNRSAFPTIVFPFYHTISGNPASSPPLRSHTPNNSPSSPNKSYSLASASLTASPAPHPTSKWPATSTPSPSRSPPLAPTATSAGTPCKALGTHNLDFAIFQSFPFAERRELQYLWKMFNALNYASLGNPRANIGAVRPGQIDSTAAARIMQMGLHVVF